MWATGYAPILIVKLKSLKEIALKEHCIVTCIYLKKIFWNIWNFIHFLKDLENNFPYQTYSNFISLFLKILSC